MSMYKYLREAWKKPRVNLGDIYKNYLIKWRKEKTIIRVDKPTRLDRARSLGYKAKQGFVIVRVMIKGGTRKREQIHSGRKPRKSGIRKVLGKNLQLIAEERAARKYKNCEVLNSYFVAEDSKQKWYEVILVDRSSPVIKKDKNLKWITQKRGRVFRGLTSSGRKSRGLRKKGKGAEKIRPSQRAKSRLAK